MSDLRHILLGAGVFLLSVWGICGCNLPPLPSGPDVGTVCEPGQPNRCVSGGLQRCNQQGSGYEVTGCGPSRRCSNGACQPIQNECESDLPFSLSGTDMPATQGGDLTLNFETTDQLDAASESLYVENCGTSPITIETAYLQRAQPAHEYERWSLADATSISGTTIEPKDDVRLNITYAPRFGFTVSPATLRLSVKADRTETFDIHLQPKVPCLTVPPRIDVGTIEIGADAPKALEIPIQNCGNVDRYVRLPSFKGREGLDLNWVEPDSVSDGIGVGSDVVKVPAGDVQDVTLEVTKVEPGHREIPLVFRAADRPGGPQSKVATILLDVPADKLRCDSEPGRPTVHLRRTPDSESSESGEGADSWSQSLEGPVDPLQPIDLHVETRHDVDVDVVERPRGSATVVEPKRPDDHWQLVPDVVGTYRVRVRPFDDYGRFGCTSNDIEFEVVPDAELHAELTWETAADPIPGDRGYGRGVDVNIHALAHNPVGASQELNGWHEPGDCTGRGRNGRRDCVYGKLESTSVSGVGAEVVSFENVEPAMVVFVARVWHPYGFGSAGATFRLWSNGTLVEQTPISRVLDGGFGSVWHIGSWGWIQGERVFSLADELRQNYPKRARTD